MDNMQLWKLTPYLPHRNTTVCVVNPSDIRRLLITLPLPGPLLPPYLAGTRANRLSAHLRVLLRLLGEHWGVGSVSPPPT